jgi:hypothetical protein
VEPWRFKKKLTPWELFAYRLCFGLKQWEHPDEMLATMPWEWFQGWHRYYCQEPWGEHRADQRMAVLAMYTKANIGWSADSLPEFEFPYFGQSSLEEVLAQKATLDQRKEEFLAKRKAKPDQGEPLTD